MLTSGNIKMAASVIRMKNVFQDIVIKPHMFVCQVVLQLQELLLLMTTTVLVLKTQNVLLSIVTRTLELVPHPVTWTQCMEIMLMDVSVIAMKSVSSKTV